MKVISLLILLSSLYSCASGEEKDPDPIRSAILSKQDEFRECYLESDSYKGRKAPDPQGVMRLSFTIDKAGKAKNGKIYESPFKDPNLDACILSMVRMIQFTFPKEGESLEVRQAIYIKARD